MLPLLHVSLVFLTYAEPRTGSHVRGSYSRPNDLLLYVQG